MKWFLVFALLGLSACKVKPRDQEDKAAEPDITVVQSTPQNINYVFEPAGVNEYLIKFNIAGFPFGTLVRRQLNDVQQAWPVSGSEWVDKVPGGADMTYEFGIFNGAQFTVLLKEKVKAPQDLYVNEVASINDAKFAKLFRTENEILVMDHFHRIFVGPKARLQFHDKSVRIEAKELVAEGGIIETFPDGLVATMGQNGRSGGRIEIEVEKAGGQLQVEMRGEGGGQGLGGKAPDTTLTGKKGKPGRNGQPATVIPKNPLDPFSFADTYVCGPGATAGEMGDQGLPGFVGGPGFRGGNSGAFQIKVTGQNDLFLAKLLLAGAGGAGGLGGAGGNGGPGGDGGKSDPVGVCGGAQGKQGPEGPRGPTGPEGQPGQTQSICSVNPDQTRSCQ